MSGHAAEKRAALASGLDFGEGCGACAGLALALGDTGLGEGGMGPVYSSGWEEGSMAAGFPFGAGVVAGV